MFKSRRMAVAKELVCIRPLMTNAEKLFKEGRTLIQVFPEIANFRQKSEAMVKKIEPGKEVIHAIGTSIPVLAAVVIFEAGRHYLSQKGINVPSSLDIVSHGLSGASLSVGTESSESNAKQEDLTRYKPIQDFASGGHYYEEDLQGEGNPLDNNEWQNYNP